MANQATQSRKPPVNLDSLPEEATPKVLKAVVQAALEGDVQAAGMILDRAIPKLRPEAAPLALGLMSGNATEDARELLRAVAEGELSATSAQEALDLLNSAATHSPADTAFPSVAALDEMFEKAMAASKREQGRVAGRSEDHV